MVDPKVFVESYINQSVITPPFIGVDYALGANPSDNLLQGWFVAFGHNFCVNSTVSLKDAKDRVFVGTSATFTGYSSSPFTSKVSFITFSLTLNGSSKLLKLMVPYECSEQLVEMVNRVSVNTYYETCLSSININTKRPNDLFNFKIAYFAKLFLMLVSLSKFSYF